MLTVCISLELLNCLFFVRVFFFWMRNSIHIFSATYLSINVILNIHFCLDKEFCCSQQAIVIIIHNNFLESIERIPIFSCTESQVTVLTVNENWFFMQRYNFKSCRLYKDVRLSKQITACKIPYETYKQWGKQNPKIFLDALEFPKLIIFF